MTSDEQEQSIVRWLTAPDSYPHPPERIEVIETHISRVFLAGPFVYKLKKPVKYDFLDFSTVAAREFACREEVRLNRRLTRDVYQDVIPIIRDGSGTLQFGGEGTVVDWVVWMRRLPTELTLESLVRRGELRREQVVELANTLVRFYRGLTPLPMTAREYVERCESHVRGNRQELMAIKHHLPPGVVERIHGFQLQQLLLHSDLFSRRVGEGRIVDGHGDLRPEHICFGESLSIFDCIEFSADFRRIDVADELAFLAAECDHLGASWVGSRLLELYGEKSDDRPPEVLLDFYKSYRACVRAKVAVLRADQSRGAQHETAVNEAHRHLKLADDYASRWVTRFVLAVGGLAGTGKSTLAQELARVFGAELLRTDVIRRELFGSGSHAAELDGGIYGPEAREQVYDILFERAASFAREHIPVVLDGTFSTVDTITRASKIADRPRDLFLAIECLCSPEESRRRIQQRLAEGRDASDAHPELHDAQRERWETWPADIPSLRINTEQSLDNQIAEVKSGLARLADLVRGDAF